MLPIWQRALIGGVTEDIFHSVLTLLIVLNLDALISDIFLQVVGSTSRDVRTRCRFFLLERSVFNPVKNISELLSKGNVSKYSKHKPIAITRRNRRMVVVWVVLFVVKLLVEGVLLWTTLEKNTKPVQAGSELKFVVGNITRSEKDIEPEYFECKRLSKDRINGIFKDVPNRKYVGAYKLCGKTDSLPLPPKRRRFLIVTMSNGHVVTTAVGLDQRLELMSLTLENDDTSGSPFVLHKKISQEEHFAVHHNHLNVMRAHAAHCMSNPLKIETFVTKKGTLMTGTTTECSGAEPVDNNRYDPNLWMAHVRAAMFSSISIVRERSREFHRIQRFIHWDGSTADVIKDSTIRLGPRTTGRHILFEYTGCRFNILGLAMALLLTIIARTVLAFFLTTDIGDEVLVAVNQMYPGMCATNKFWTWLSSGEMVMSSWRTGPKSVHVGFNDHLKEADLQPADAIGIRMDNCGNPHKV